MPANNVYECMFLLDSGKVSGDIPAAADRLHAILQKHQAEILASRPWDERRLSYPIRKQKKGLYYLTYFRIDTKNITPMNWMMSRSSKLVLTLRPRRFGSKIV